MNEAELLFTDTLDCDRQQLYLNRDSILGKNQGRLIAGALLRRAAGEPLQYILAKTEFMGGEFKLSPDVFIPRPETEILTQVTAMIALKRLRTARRRLRILDLCTGSGCIAVSLAKMLPNADITAADISRKALDIAALNAGLHKVEDRIHFVESDLFVSLPICDMRYAICVCNPPYIPAAEISSLQPEISYEPRLALDGGSEGLDFYRRIIPAAGEYLEKEGFLILEIGFGQYPRIREFFREREEFASIEVIRDYNGFERVVIAQKWIK